MQIRPNKCTASTLNTWKTHARNSLAQQDGVSHHLLHLLCRRRGRSAAHGAVVAVGPYLPRVHDIWFTSNFVVPWMSRTFFALSLHGDRSREHIPGATKKRARETHIQALKRRC